MPCLSPVIRLPYPRKQTFCHAEPLPVNASPDTHEAGSRDRDYSIALWMLKLGGVANLYFMLNTPLLASEALWIAVPAQILFAVSAYRCLFPVRYEGNVVLHDLPLSSVFVTRALATFSEVAYIYLFSCVLRWLNQEQLAWVTALSWIMVIQVVASQGFVWVAILTGRLEHYFHEELGWALIFAANTAASAGLWFSSHDMTDDSRLLLSLNLLFGLFYLPWQCLHLRFLRANARQARTTGAVSSVAEGLIRAMRIRNRRTDAPSWGGWIGLSWMTAYWATLIPLWVFTIALVLHER